MKGRRGVHVVAIGAHHGEAGEVLRGHGDDKERQRDLYQRLEGEDRRVPGERREGHDEGAVRDVGAGENADPGDDDGQRHGEARREFQPQRPGDEDGQSKGRQLAHGAQRREAELEQDARQHGRGEGAGNGRDGARQRAHEAAAQHHARRP